MATLTKGQSKVCSSGPLTHENVNKLFFSTLSQTKRHRDRLSGDLDKLASLLPFCADALDGFILVVSTEGCIFYASPTIQYFLGFHQSDVIHQSIYELIHIEDHAVFRWQLYFAFDSKDVGDAPGNSENHSLHLLPPENSILLDRNFCCRFRCLLDGSSGFLALNFQGRLKYLPGDEKPVERISGAQSRLALFAVASPVQPCGILEIRTKTLIFQTKHKLDFAPLSVKGKVVLGYTELELCSRSSGYQFIHAADMMYCADSHLRKGRDAVFRLLTKSGVWVWVQASARVMFQGEKPDFIIAQQKPLTNEEGEEHLRRRSRQLPFSFAGEAVLYETVPSVKDPTVQSCPYTSTEKSRPPDQTGLGCLPLLGSLLRQDQSVSIQPPEPEIQSLLVQPFADSHTLSVPSATQKLDPPEPSREQIPEKGGMKGALRNLEVNREDLMEWDKALLRIRLERGEEPAQLNGIMASDVFAYVEEALWKESSLTDSEQSEPKAASSGKAETSGTSQSETMELLQSGMLPTKPHSESAVYGCEEQGKSSKRNASGFLGLGFQPLLLKTTDLSPHSPS
uniref:PAS domain-containing protein n=1 Tax=Electrophorus electricus TaxID=8005 RepID=A0A4W4HD98_ELEEL